MFEMFVIMFSVSLLFGLVMYVDTKFFLPKRTAKYLETMRVINDVNKR